MPDISHTIVAKSDQLNAGDLAAPITVTVRSVRVTRDDQPVIVDIGDDYQPWKPCKGMRRLLARTWGTNTDTWPGHRVTLFNDHTAKWAGEEVGGIRVKAMSGISRSTPYNMRTSKKGTKRYDVAPLEKAAPAAPAITDAEARAKFLKYAKGKGVTPEHVAAYLATKDAILTDLSADDLRGLARDIGKIQAFAAEHDKGDGEWDDVGGGES